MTIWVKTKIKRPIYFKLSAIDHIYQHLFEKKLLDDILLDAYECIATKRMVKNTIFIFDYSCISLGLTVPKIPKSQFIKAYLVANLSTLFDFGA